MRASERSFPSQIPIIPPADSHPLEKYNDRPSVRQSVHLFRSTFPGTDNKMYKAQREREGLYQGRPLSYIGERRTPFPFFPRLKRTFHSPPPH